MNIKLISKIRRGFDRKDLYEPFYLILVVVVFVTFGIYGIFPLIKIIQKKYVLIERVRDYNSLMTQKVSDLSSVEKKHAIYKFALSNLENTFPDKADPQGYLVDFAKAVSSNGYKQEYFQANTDEKNIVNINVLVSGGLKRFPHLVSRIESLYRLTTINDFSFDIKKNLAKGSMKVSIYYIEK